jgi:hypothetical protein
VNYLKHAKLRGSLFEEVPSQPKAVCCVDTGFFVDHAELEEVLNSVRRSWDGWSFGDLPEGHELLIIVKAGHEA